MVTTMVRMTKGDQAWRSAEAVLLFSTCTALGFAASKREMRLGFQFFRRRSGQIRLTSAEASVRSSGPM